MKSPIFQQQYNSGLNLSAVYEQRKSKTPTSYLQVNNGQPERQKEILQNRSFVFDNEVAKKQYSNLRSTIGSPTCLLQGSHKKPFDNFLRNTSHFTINYSKFDETPLIKNDTQNNKQNLSQKNTPNSTKKQYFDSKEPHRTFENTGNNYNKIMQKYDKKQKLIKELKKLTEVKISEKIRQTFEFEKGNGAQKGNQIYTDRIMINITSPKPQTNDSSMRKIDLNKSTVAEKSKNEASYTNLKEKFLNKIIPSNPREPNIKPNSKNPQEESKKITYFTPKVVKNNADTKFEGRFTPKINTAKDILNSRTYLNISDVRLTDKTSSTLKNTSFSNIEILSPTISVKSKESATKTKTMKDVKDMVELRKEKVIANHFSKKSLTINDFQLGKALGEGKFGTVYQAVHKQTKYLVALKKISKVSIKSNYMIDQFLLEVKIQSFCDHQNILKLFGCFDDKQNIYLILEYMEDGTLFKYLKLKKAFTEAEASIKLKQVAEGIRYLHEKGIAHRDIKPENIVISHGVGKLCDFGWAAICDERRKTYCGTFDYAAPEILEGAEYDMSVDLWCLGVLAYELMVGRAPFYHISRKQTMKKILNVESTAIEFPSSMSKQAVSFIQNLIRKRPEQRMTAENVLRHPFLFQDGK